MAHESKPDPVEDYRNIQREVKEWEKYLNDNVGYFAFTFAVASLGTSMPQLWAMISLVFIVAGHVVNKKGKMATLERVVALRKKSDSEYYAFVEKEARKTISVKRSIPFVIGYVTLVVIMLAPALMPSDWVSFLYGGKPYLDFATLTLKSGVEI